MAIYNTYPVTLSGHEAPTEQDAIDYARGMVWCELEAEKQTIKYANHVDTVDTVDTVDGVGVWYDFGADYYFFTDEG